MLRLRPATAADADLLLEWRNDPVTRAASFTTGEVHPAKHRAWLAARLTDPLCRLSIAEWDGVPIGQVRVTRIGDRCGEISVALAPEARGQGLAAAVITEACAASAPALALTTVVASIRPENERSRRAFEAAGFRLSTVTSEALTLTWRAAGSTAGA